MTSQNKKVEGPPTSSQPRDTRAVIFMLTTIADTTWRMFIPTIGLTYLGWLADKQWNTKPWLFILGIIVGSGISTALVYRQLNPTKKI